MKKLATLVLIPLVSACAGSAQDEVKTQVPAAAPSTSAVHNYRCESGATIAATYSSTETATVHYKGSSHSMQIAVSGSGARYVGDGLEWWTKGSGPESTGTLFQHAPDGSTGDVIENCTGL